MKHIFLTSAFTIMSISATPALANMKCLEKAKLEARIFSSMENREPLENIKVENYFFHSETNGTLYYGILLDNRDEINVGLKKQNCVLVEINYVN